MTSRSLTVRLLHGVREDTLPRLCGQCQGEDLREFPLTWIPAGSYNSLNDRAFFDSRGPGPMSEFTHFNESGRARMVDVSEKAAPHRTATVKTTGQTGVEMEALTAVSVAALTIYDMCKAVDRGMVFTDIGLLEKTGGKSGTYRRKT